MGTQGLRAKVIASTKLSTLRFMSDVALRLISTVVLTRLLAPEIYGVFAVVLVYAYVLAMVSDLGLRSVVLTYENQPDEEFLSTCWTVSILRGVLIALLSVGIAGVIGNLQSNGVFGPDSPYAAPDLPWALVGLGIATLLAGFQSPVSFVIEREMKFGRVTLAHVASNLVSLVATIALAIYLRSIWALVLGSMARSLAQVTFSFLLFPGPGLRLRLSKGPLKAIIDRGKWIIGHSTMTAASMSADRLVLGLVMNSTTFGFYFIARQVVELVMQFIQSIDAQVGLQVFRHLHQTTHAEFKSNYYRYRLFFDVLAGLSTGGLFVMAPLLVGIVFDDRYAGVAPIIQITIWGAMLIGPILLRSAFSAERRFKQMTILSLVTTVTLWAGLGITVFLMQSVTAALVVIALHRLPEAILCTAMGLKRGWVIWWREGIGLVFCALGAGIGYVLLNVWGALT